MDRQAPDGTPIARSNPTAPWVKPDDMAATLPVDIASIPSDRASLILDLAERVRQLNIGLRMKRAEYDTVQQQVSKLNQEAAEIEHQLKATQAALLNCVGEQ